ncbi:MAG: tail fiber domain-containing protein [Candidatus Udaeobacter sp.]
MKNRNIVLTTIIFALGSFALPQRTQAVVPAPDGGYPRFNTAEGQNALFSLTTGQWNTALGAFTLRSDTDGSYNTAVGTAALLFNVGNQNAGSGIKNTAVGAAALLLNTAGSSNTGLGADALLNNTSGMQNTATGDSALLANTHGSINTALGDGALAANNGDANTAVGNGALFNNTTGSGNIALGFNAGSGVSTANNVICIGADGNNVDNACYIGQIFSSTVSASAVFVNSNGRLGTMTSSQRFKQDIKPMDNVSEALYSLKPVSFRYKKEFDSAGAPQLGLVAEEVEKVNPDLIIRDKEGKPYTVRYEQINTMLLNEFLKEHGKVEKLEAALDTVKKRLNEQEARIQKVSAEVEVSEPAAKTALNSQ